jgi:hypothetical protein
MPGHPQPGDPELPPTANGQEILHLKMAGGPYRFEWHTRKRRVYLIRVSGGQEIGEIVAMDIQDHGAAINAVYIWLRGYNEGRNPDIVKTHLVD